MALKNNHVAANHDLPVAILANMAHVAANHDLPVAILANMFYLAAFCRATPVGFSTSPNWFKPLPVGGRSR